MRVFLPSTLPELAEALRAGQLGSSTGSSTGAGVESGTGSSISAAADQQPGYAVTPALREAYASGDEEELEYAALTEAARASLRMLAGNPAAPPRRVVLAAEIPADEVKLDATDREPARVLVTAVIPVDKLASAHVDDGEAGPDVRTAADALDAADAGDDDARFAVDGAEGHELAWYATQELSYLAE